MQFQSLLPRSPVCRALPIQLSPIPLTTSHLKPLLKVMGGAETGPIQGRGRKPPDSLWGGYCQVKKGKLKTDGECGQYSYFFSVLAPVKWPNLTHLPPQSLLSWPLLELSFVNLTVPLRGLRPATSALRFPNGYLHRSRQDRFILLESAHAEHTGARLQTCRVAMRGDMSSSRFVAGEIFLGGRNCGGTFIYCVGGA